LALLANPRLPILVNDGTIAETSPGLIFPGIHLHLLEFNRS
jgi:hypothetical protein